MKVIRIENDPHGPRLKILGRRIHHGLSGCLLAIFGIGLAVHDRKDFKQWL